MLAIWRKVKDGEKLYSGSIAFREALRELVARKLRLNVTETDYDNPSWSHKQAHQNGYNQAVREMLALIKEEKE